ncbi:germination protein YpeB [Thermanaeromonas toyohensis ToBE]|uniref:Germination protein YpeB n=1 Tax=Thermanaeromonas toyohensis ToBE TaxID=698762 RepID=A0A1W1VDG3_9FIRM|nr:germination protein YpeB [Thermanaeromonas toyohensis]SMB91355.1 germination protein YpeB [Thermanaeromonas toyohensis ToBE]
MERKRWTVWVLSLLLLAAISWGFWERANRLALAHAVEGSGQRDFYNLLTQVEQTEVSLGKALVSTSKAQQAALLTQASNQAAGAQTSLSQLPTPGINLIGTRKFLAQTADYCQYLAQRVAHGQPPSNEEIQNLIRLRQEMGRLAADLHNIEGQVATHAIRWSSFYSLHMPSLPRTMAWLKARPVQATPHPLEGFVNTDRHLQTLPSLNYDGPFSDHLEKARPLGLAAQSVDQPAAEKNALKFANDASGTTYRVASVNPVNGRIPCFGMSLTDEKRPGRQARIDVSRQGGHIISFLNPRAVEAPTIDVKAAQERAAAFLKAQGFPDMVPTYTLSQGHAQLFTFVARERDILLYPDQIKVKVALDNGEIVGFDATPFFMAHHKRDLPTPQVSAKEITAKLKPHLKVEGIRLALIPTGGGREVLTYEVSTKLDTERYLLYFNALTGEEEKIMKIIDLPGGQLTM